MALRTFFSNAASASRSSDRPRAGAPAAEFGERRQLQIAAGRIDEDLARQQILFDRADAVDRPVQTDTAATERFVSSSREATLASTCFMSFSSSRWCR